MGLLGLSEHTPKGLWSRKSEYEYVNMTLTTLGFLWIKVQYFAEFSIFSLFQEVLTQIGNVVHFLESAEADSVSYMI